MTQLDSRTPQPGTGHDHELTQRLRGDVARRLAREAAAGPDGAQPLTPARRAELGRRLIAEALDAEAARALTDARAPLDAGTERQIGQAVFDAIFGLGGFQPFLDDPDVESVNANGCDEVFVQYAGGRRVRAAPIAGSDAELTDLIRSIATRAGNEERRFDRATPRVSVPLPGGGRLFAVMAVTGRPCVAIRRDRLASASLAGLVANGTLDEQLAAFLAAVVRARKNILVSGGTAVGKTTLLRALASAIPPRERLITIEDSLELCLDWDTGAHPDVVAMQSREKNVEGEGEITLAELVRWALRMTPDRVIVGEVRGSEVVPMLNAMSQGNDGSMTTIHASSSRGAFMKVASYAAQSAEHLGLEDTNLLIAGAVHVVIQLDWDRHGRRCISSIREVTDADGRQVVSNEVYAPGPDRRAVPSVPVRGRHHGRAGRGRVPARRGGQVTGGSVALAGLLGAGAGLGLVLVFCALRRRPAVPADPRWRDALARARRQATMPRVGGTLLAAAVAAAITRWPAGTVLAGLAAWFLPRALGPDRAGDQSVRRIEGIASWAEQLRDTLAAAAGLEQAILATAPIAPEPVREQVTALAARIHQGQRLPDGLRAFAAEAADPAADLVVAALLLAAEQQARDLGQLLSSLADSARQHAAMRMRIAAARARVRTASRIIIAVTVALTAGLLAWSRAFLAPYGSPAGQLMLLAVGACFAAAFWWLHKIAGFGENPRILTGLGGLPGTGPHEAGQ